jgi:hypothetical protein
MVDNTGTDAAPRSRAFVRWVLRGVAAQCFVCNRFFRILFFLRLKTALAYNFDRDFQPFLLLVKAQRTFCKVKF